MIYILIVLVVIVGLWALMVYIRKTMWDAVHRNLLDLEDQFNGKVFRRGFASRPYFHGKIDGIDTTINFSSEKTDGKRITYVDISYARPSSVSFTLTNLNWLRKQHSDGLEDSEQLQNGSGERFLIRPSSNPQVKKLINSPLIIDIMDNFTNLAYIFVGPSGIISEFITEEVIKSTEFDELQKRIQMLEQLGEAVQ
ncbi:MAG: hypothetical protein GF313_01145 [Caldithrix sp.]|nr:hypothetical protein [Caldithrix sp.]